MDFDPYQEYEGIPDELATEIRELLTVEVRVTMKQAYDDLEQYKKDNKELRDRLDVTNNELRILKREGEANLKKALVENAKQVQRDLFNGFTVGDKAYVRKYSFHRAKCLMCNGAKKVSATIEGNIFEVSCPLCRGYGYNESTTSTPEAITIRSIGFEFHSGGVRHAKYYTDRTDYSQDKVFKTIEDCQAVCTPQEGN